MRKIKFIILLGVIIINCMPTIAQNKKNNLDANNGIDLIKLEQPYIDINQKIELYPYGCPWCSERKGLDKRVLIKELQKINIAGITTNENSYLTFVDDLLYKIEICLPNNELLQKNLINYFTEQYGESYNESEKIKIWETEKTYLKVYIPTTISRQDQYSIVTMYSKNLDNNLKLKEEKLNVPEPKIEETIKERIGKGNSTFIPDINNALKLFKTSTNRKNLEAMLPNYTVIDTLFTTHKFNEKTNNHDILDELVSKYTFMYNSEYMVFMEVRTKKGIISKIEYSFDTNQDLNKLKKQIINNGFTLDLKLSKVISKLGFNNCFVFTKKPNYNFTIYSERRFSISK